MPLFHFILGEREIPRGERHLSDRRHAQERRNWLFRGWTANEIDQPALEVHVGVLPAHLHVHGHLLGLLPPPPHLLPLENLPSSHRISLSDWVVQCCDQGHAEPGRR